MKRGNERSAGAAFGQPSLATALQGFLRALEHDLDFLARNAEIRELAQAEASGQRERVAALRKEVEDELWSSAKASALTTRSAT